MTITLKRSFFAFVGLLLTIVFLSSCGSQPSTSSTTSSAQPAATSAPASSNSNDYSNDYGPSAAATPTTSASTSSNTSANSNALIKSASVTVSGKSMMVLTDTKGMTLYYFTPDTAAKIACTSSCAAAWPPLLASGSSAPTAAGSLPGALTTLSSANGSQVLYNGHALYTYASDTAPGQANGQGVGGNWFVATPDLAKQ